MIYRIDMQNFITHAIDHFTLDDLLEMQYAIISAKVVNTGKSLNVVKVNELYPLPETIVTYAETQDKDLLEKMYLELLNGEDIDNQNEFSNDMDVNIYRLFINPLLHHVNICIVCDRFENDYVDILCNHLKNKFDIEVIDLNELFTKGRVGPIYLDRDQIWDNAVDIRRAAAKEQSKRLGTTLEGKEKLIRKMTKKEKIEKLEELGLKYRGESGKELNNLILEEWVHDDNIKRLNY